MDALAPEYGLGLTTYAAECRSNLAEATGWVWAFVLLGVLVLLASAIIMAVLRSAQNNRATAAPALPTAASQIEHLARLRDQGLVTPEEFEWKKQDILRSS
ncbi:SHOCT domain-containing protein [Paenarthrobacter nicotinovorans]|uniref:SHOCT domain-containing protein n=1 Tax=Paenarthrobacter nicotinovorans TaxID=29320 RepID=UPI0037F4339A